MATSEQGTRMPRANAMGRTEANPRYLERFCAYGFNGAQNARGYEALPVAISA
jgi:hypothetical protein